MPPSGKKKRRAVSYGATLEAGAAAGPSVNSSLSAIQASWNGAVFRALRTFHRGVARGGFGLANFEASIGWLGCNELSSVRDRPSVHVTVQRKGTCTPATSR